MTTRERFLAGGVLSVLILAGGGFLVQMLFLGPLKERKTRIIQLQQDVDEKQARVDQINADKAKLKRWELISLPNDPNSKKVEFPATALPAKREYANYLSDLFRTSGLTAVVTPREVDVRSSPTIGVKVPVYAKLFFHVQAKGTLESFVKAMERFHHTGLLHQVHDFAINRPLTPGPDARPGELDITLTVEALLLDIAPKRATLLPGVDSGMASIDVATALQGGPPGLAGAIWATWPTGPLGPSVLAQPRRDYSLIAAKNIFLGLEIAAYEPDVEVTRFMYLTDITQNDVRAEASLYDRYNNKKTRLRSQNGFNSFRITESEDGSIVRGKVVRIEDRDVVFEVNDKTYSMHVGQNLEEAMRKPLAQEKLKELKSSGTEEKSKEAKSAVSEERPKDARPAVSEEKLKVAKPVPAPAQ